MAHLQHLNELPLALTNAHRKQILAGLQTTSNFDQFCNLLDPRRSDDRNHLFTKWSFFLHLNECSSKEQLL